ncbi:hypothetical protein [Latilactobacillus curvatus]|uniref:hypothetical protein n=1 Tax=Latilactobacillus curvatus TaxID=28038 RepID=UPI0013DF96E9|nr:hypothetical protein [Latilactobacillus curvatus]
MDKVVFEGGKIYVNGEELRAVESINIFKKASNITEVTVKFDAKVQGLDITD